jgi:hypothetical protein
MEGRHAMTGTVADGHRCTVLVTDLIALPGHDGQVHRP